MGPFIIRKMQQNIKARRINDCATIMEPESTKALQLVLMIQRLVHD